VQAGAGDEQADPEAEHDQQENRQRAAITIAIVSYPSAHFAQVCQPIERALQDEDRGVFVDHQARRARLMSARSNRARRRRWRAARPQRDGEIGEFGEIAGKGAGGLRARAFAGVHVDG